MYYVVHTYYVDSYIWSWSGIVKQKTTGGGIIVVAQSTAVATAMDSGPHNYLLTFLGKPQSLWNIILNNIKHDDYAATRCASLAKQVSTSGVLVMQKELALGTGAHLIKAEAKI